MIADRFDLGLVTDAQGEPKKDAGYATYVIGGVEGEIEINGPKAALIADRIVYLMNTQE